MHPLRKIDACVCCGSTSLSLRPILWRRLIKEWKINASEVDYINRQQGLSCDDCDSSLRTMALALSIMRSYGFQGLFTDFTSSAAAQKLRVLEINEAGQVTQFLKQIPGHLLGRYPEVDMTKMAFADDSFDLVVHSDTLEHVPQPVQALAECRRVLKPHGICAYTVPIIVGRLTRSRSRSRPSYHGDTTNHREDYRVVSEYGADAWRDLVQAGFDECRIFTPEHPAAHALVGVKCGPVAMPHPCSGDIQATATVGAGAMSGM